MILDSTGLICFDRDHVVRRRKLREGLTNDDKKLVVSSFFSHFISRFYWANSLLIRFTVRFSSENVCGLDYAGPLFAWNHDNFELSTTSVSDLIDLIRFSFFLHFSPQIVIPRISDTRCVFKIDHPRASHGIEIVSIWRSSQILLKKKYFRVHGVSHEGLNRSKK